jgi:hypothetical protein
VEKVRDWGLAIADPFATSPQLLCKGGTGAARNFIVAIFERQSEETPFWASEAPVSVSSSVSAKPVSAGNIRLLEKATSRRSTDALNANGNSHY